MAGEGYQEAGHQDRRTPLPITSVPGKAKLADAARRVLEKFSIDINSAENGVFLPRDKSILGGTGAAHNVIHTSQYYRLLNQLLTNATTREDAIAVLDYIRKLLLSGIVVR